MPIRFARTAAKAFVLAMVAALAACSSLRPQLSPNATVSKNYRDNPTLPNAVDLAESLRDQYAAKVEDHLYMERASGLTLIGLGAIGANLAMRQIAKNEVLGLGLVGAAVYTGTNWAHGKPEQFVYAAGANAIQCALDAMQPMTRVYPRRDELATLARTIDASATALDRIAGPSANRTVAVLRAQSVVEQARRVAPLARSAVAAMDGSGAELRSSVSAIQLQVTNAVLANSSSLQGLMESLGSALPALGGKIVGLSFAAIPAQGGIRTSSDESLIESQTRQLEQAIADAEQIIAEVNAKPALDKLKNCNIDLKQAGLTFKVLPGGDIAVQAGSPGTTVVMTSGVVPYLAPVWIGARPPVDQIDFKWDAVSGAVTIEAKRDAPLGSYPLLIRDAAQGRESVLVVVKAAAPAPAPAGAQAGAGAALAAKLKATPSCTVDPQVKKVQDALLAKGIKSAKVAGVDKALTADGCMGPITTAAILQFYNTRDGKPSPERSTPDPVQLLKEAATDLGVV